MSFAPEPDDQTQSLNASPAACHSILSGLMKRLPVAIAVIDRSMKYLAASRLWMEVFAPDGQDLRGLPHFEVFPNLSDDWREAHEKAMAGETVSIESKAFGLSSAASRWVRWEIAPWRDESGGVAGVTVVSHDLTESMRAKEILQESEVTKALWVEAAGMATWDVDCRTGTAHWSQSHFTMLGYPANEDGTATMEMWFACVHPEDKTMVQQALDDARENGGDYRPEYRIVRADNAEVRWVGVFGRFLLNPSGDAERFVGTLFDITERKQAEEALSVSEARLRFVTERASVGSWHWDLATNSLEMSTQCMQLLGMSESAPLEYERFLEAVHPDDRVRTDAAVRASLSGGEHGDYDIEYRVTWADGTLHWIHAKGSATFESGRPMRMAGILFDITDRKVAEEASRDSEKRLSAALRGGRMGMWDWDVQNDLAVWNSIEYELLGMPVGDGRERASRFFECVHPDDLPDLQKMIFEVMDEGSDFYHEIRVRRKDGVERWLACASNLERDAEGRPLRMIGVNFDVTERRNLQEQLRETARQLAEANRQKDIFLATLAHELRNPLASVRSGLEVQRRSTDLQAIEEARAIMERQTLQLVSLVDDLLEVSRISQGKLTLKKRRISLTAAVGSAVEAAKPLLDGSGLEFHFVEPEADVWVDGDPNRLAQIVTNLINNAVKFTPSPGKIILSVREQETECAVAVEDTGIGLAENMLEKIFNIFTQIEQPDDSASSGLGLGLNLVKLIAELHGGTIRAASHGLGKGSVFTIRLPRAARPEQDPNASAPAPFSGAKQGLNRKILVADDNEGAARMLSILLKMRKLEVRCARDGEEACRAAEEFRPRWAILDVGMPKRSGREVAQYIRAQEWGQKMVLIALTGWGQDGDKEKSRHAGFDYHLVKPVDHAELERILDLAEGAKSSASEVPEV